MGGAGPPGLVERRLGPLREVMAQSGVDSKDVKGLGHLRADARLVMLDKEGKVLRRSIIWCDQRTARQCEEITQLVGKSG